MDLRWGFGSSQARFSRWFRSSSPPNTSPRSLPRCVGPRSILRHERLPGLPHLNQDRERPGCSWPSPGQVAEPSVGGSLPILASEPGIQGCGDAETNSTYWNLLIVYGIVVQQVGWLSFYSNRGLGCGVMTPRWRFSASGCRWSPKAVDRWILAMPYRLRHCWWPYNVARLGMPHGTRGRLG